VEKCIQSQKYCEIKKILVILANISPCINVISIGSSSTLEPLPYENDEREEVEQEVGGEEEEFDESGDLFSGAKEFESYKQVQSIKKKIQFNLGRRSGPRWSLPFGT
jgi:hypothetical protein